MSCSEIAKHLSLPPVKLHCSMLAEDAIKAAVKDYEAKRAKATASGEAATGEKPAIAWFLSCIKRMMKTTLCLFVCYSVNQLLIEEHLH